MTQFDQKILENIKETEQLLTTQKRRKTWCTSKLTPFTSVLFELRKHGKSLRFMAEHLALHHKLRISHSAVAKYLKKLSISRSEGGI